MCWPTRPSNAGDRRKVDEMTTTTTSGQRELVRHAALTLAIALEGLASDEADAADVALYSALTDYPAVREATNAVKAARGRK